MKNQKFQEAFACVKASDDTVNAVLNIPVEQEIPRRPSRWQTVRRVAACAAMVAVLIGAMVLPGPPAVVTDPTGGTQLAQQSMFGIRVYADDGIIDLAGTEGEVVFAGKANTSTGDLGQISDGRAYFYNTETGEWELLVKPPEYKLPRLDFAVWYQDLMVDYDFLINVYLDNKIVETSNTENIERYYAADKGGPNGSSRYGVGITCCIDRSCIMDVEILDKDTGATLIFYSLRITPAIYETQAGDSTTSGESDICPVINEGYMLEVLDSYRIKIN